MAKRLDIETCAGIVIDVQEFFLKQLDNSERRRIETGIADFVSFLTYLRIPILSTIEQPVAAKGGMPVSIQTGLSRGSAIVEKEFFDLTAETKALALLGTFGRKQMIVAGCETDVCVLQSCIGLLNLGFEVYLMEDLVFSSAKDCSAALARMKAEGVTFLNFKTLYHELLRAVRESAHRKTLEENWGSLPENIADL